MMGTRTIRLDEETEQVLAELKQLTGLSLTQALKQGLFAFRDEVCHRGSARPFDIYKSLDLGDGGYAVAPSTDSKRGVQEAIKRKLSR